jgi:excisionase family DNA binding protein
MMLRAITLAERWDVDESTVYRWCREGVIPCRRLGGVVRIPLAEIERIERGDECQSRIEDTTCGSTPEPGSGKSDGSSLVYGGLSQRARAAASKLRLSSPASVTTLLSRK